MRQLSKLNFFFLCVYINKQVDKINALFNAYVNGIVTFVIFTAFDSATYNE